MAIWFGVVASLLIAGANAQCPEEYQLIGDRCLKFITDAVYDVLSAQQTCSDYDGQLVKVDDCKLLGLLSDYIISNGIDTQQLGFWTGGYDDENGRFLWGDETPVAMGAPFWGRGPDYEGEPTLNSYNDNNCVIMYEDDGFYFHNYECQYSMIPLCQHDGEDGGCPATYTDIEGYCYQAVPSLQVDSVDAQAICETSAGYLAKIDDCNVMAGVIDYVQNLDMLPSSFTGIWLGAFRFGSKWQWVDNSEMPMGVPFWGRGSYGSLAPYGDETTYGTRCIELWAHDRYYFHDDSCQEAYKFPICETAQV